MSGPKTGIELSKTEITKIEENLDETVKHCLKRNVYKFLTRNALFCPLLGVSSIEILMVMWIGT